MNTKPVAWMKNAKQGQHTSLIFTGFETEGFEPLIPAIPDTHRVVPVALLKSYQEAIEAGQFMGFDNEYNAMQAIIDNKEVVK